MDDLERSGQLADALVALGYEQRELVAILLEMELLQLLELVLHHKKKDFQHKGTEKFAKLQIIL